MDVLHLLSLGEVSSAYEPMHAPHGCPGSSGSRDWVAREGGPIQIGHAGSGFAFDNEGPRHSQAVSIPELESTLQIAEGEEILTEISSKLRPEGTVIELGDAVSTWLRRGRTRLATSPSRTLVARLVESGQR